MLRVLVTGATGNVGSAPDKKAADKASTITAAANPTKLEAKKYRKNQVYPLTHQVLKNSFCRKHLQNNLTELRVLRLQPKI